jgi:hypothetical protein
LTKVFVEQRLVRLERGEGPPIGKFWIREREVFQVCGSSLLSGHVEGIRNDPARVRQKSSPIEECREGDADHFLLSVHQKAEVLDSRLILDEPNCQPSLAEGINILYRMLKREARDGCNLVAPIQVAKQLLCRLLRSQLLKPNFVCAAG